MITNMKENIDIVTFTNALLKATYGSVNVKLLSIGCTSDGYYILRCKDEYNHEKIFKVPCYEEA